jgi:hypothetical protein
MKFLRFGSLPMITVFTPRNVFTASLTKAMNSS